MVIWEPHPKGIFSVDSAWELIRPHHPALAQFGILWQPGHIPRHSFILWAGLRWPNLQWNSLIQWAAANHHGRRNIRNRIARSILASSVYFLWLERNRRVFRGQAQGAQFISDQIFQTIRAQLSCMTSSAIPNAIQGNLEPGHLDSPLKPSPAGLDLYPAFFLRPRETCPPVFSALGLSVLPYGLRPREACSSAFRLFVKPFGLRFGEACSPFFFFLSLQAV
ncbi:hypothetical protein OIU84_018240 [Salix udensis]|uniref:Reverse transcriptase zinc-binding domain-containing protein n=1 Tax=Salix udensis TaxID=889485 RepID=A0AAD6NPQ6_9ROSI|nr:hypothetical protein OIU84_018240 [Salix udensis]